MYLFKAELAEARGDSATGKATRTLLAAMQSEERKAGQIADTENKPELERVKNFNARLDSETKRMSATAIVLICLAVVLASAAVWVTARRVRRRSEYRTSGRRPRHKLEDRRRHIPRRRLQIRLGEIRDYIHQQQSRIRRRSARTHPGAHKGRHAAIVHDRHGHGQQTHSPRARHQCGLRKEKPAATPRKAELPPSYFLLLITFYFLLFTSYILLFCYNFS